MRLIKGLTSQPKQKFTMTADTGEIVFFSLSYNDRTRLWYIGIDCQLETKRFTIRKMALTLFPNILHQFSDIIPFGITVKSKDNTMPFLLNDFETERIKIYLLSKDDVNAISEVIR